MIFLIIELFPCWFASRLWNILLCEKYSAIIRWTPRNVTALQVVRTSFLGPRPLSSPAGSGLVIGPNQSLQGIYTLHLHFYSSIAFDR